MAVTLEQVEKLKERAHVSYEEAKAVLERHDGDLLEAIIDLERQGRSDTASQGGFYTTRPGDAPDHAVPLPVQTGRGRRGEPYDVGYGFGSTLRDLLRRSLSNHVELWHGDRLMTSIPLLVLALLVVFFFWVTIPLLVVGLVFGCRLRLGGPDLDHEDKINQVMDDVSVTLDGVRQNIRREFTRKK